MGQKQLYGPQFKQEACALVRGQGYSAKEAARQLGIPQTTLLAWLKALREKEQPRVAEAPELEAMRARIRELEGKLARSEMEKDILKKAAAYFAKEQP
jgi:transposase